MKKLNNTLIISSLLLLLLLFILFKHSSCTDPWFNTCIPKHCGDGVNITYPFFINNKQNSSCGYPGFQLNCNNNNHPILRVSETDFIVKHIDTNTRKIKLQYAAISSNSFQFCQSKLRTLKLGPIRFEVDNSTTTKLVFVSNCTDKVSRVLDRYRITLCDNNNNNSSNSNSREFIMSESDWNNTRKVSGGGCGEVVEVPVEAVDGVVVDGWNYTKVMELGFWMRWIAADCGECERSGGRCGFNMTAYRPICFCEDRPYQLMCQPPGKLKPKPKRRLLIILVAIGCAIIFALAAAIFFTIRAYKRKFVTYADKSRELEDTSVYFGVSVFSYAELQDATEHFDSSKELGDGGFGTVYYGKLRDGREVAVKRLYEHNYKRVQQFMNEVEILTRLRHKNLVSLYGCTSRRSRELLLVYEYIPNGTIADHLHGDRAKDSPLTWQTRMKIAIETANALVYLHASEIIHRDVKTNNILLDNNYCVKVADFGLSRLLPNDVTHVSTAPQGTPGYVDPKYYQCYQLTDKSDVYSFGVVLIELISSKPALDISRSRDEIVLANMAINMIQRCALDELIDPFLASDQDTEKMIQQVAELAFRCLQFDSETRPAMNEVLDVLKAIRVEDSDDIAELTIAESKLPPPTPENEGVELLKGRITTSPVSVTAKWYSTSSGSITPNASVSN
ncbi:LEAF RUST 10 DISEASE-RESISTANCE LOCUS RECEPTOR-LIKE PROTEIN KINASE-like 1.2 [Bidens hawaiensis]|uniref:LEAF RUST 10 DISEASE-RESISTANCE LOCUS RECEPTOR-LIKE PROTEIN KINASE-like 1.2 n=1 Tax=Bidens hawaiensis TaxID=980011 RepID=UPI004049B6F3